MSAETVDSRMQQMVNDLSAIAAGLNRGEEYTQALGVQAAVVAVNEARSDIEAATEWVWPIAAAP